jgi:hypothetical protein
MTATTMAVALAAMLAAGEGKGDVVRVEGPGGTSWKLPTGWVPTAESANLPPNFRIYAPLPAADAKYAKAEPARLWVNLYPTPLVVSEAELEARAKSAAKWSGSFAEHVGGLRQKSPPRIGRVADRPSMEFLWETPGPDDKPQLVRQVLLPAGPRQHLLLRLTAPADRFDARDRDFQTVLDSLTVPPGEPEALPPPPSAPQPSAEQPPQPTVWSNVNWWAALGGGLAGVVFLMVTRRPRQTGK